MVAGSVAAGREYPSPSWKRARVDAVRLLALLGLPTFGVLPLVVVLDAGRRLAAGQSGELVHVTGAAAALAVGAVSLGGLLLRPRSAGFATSTGATVVAVLAAALLVGNPDNRGGHDGLIDPTFLLLALPSAAAAGAAAPWREWRWRSPNPRLLALAVLGSPALWFGVQQALVQRHTWPPVADPHHQGHWWAMGVLGMIVVSVLAGSAVAAARVVLVVVALGVIAVAGMSLLSPAAASAVPFGWALAAVTWGVALLGVSKTLLAGERS